jgi:hypothetical protein
MTASMIQAGVTVTARAVMLPGAGLDRPHATIKHRVSRPTSTGGNVARIAAALLCATAVTALPLRAIADDDRGHDRGHERRHEEHRRHYEVYAPPPVYYPQVASPGISIVFPIRIR